MLFKFYPLTIPELESTTSPILEMFTVIFDAAVPLIGAVGAVLCVVLGVKYAKADEPQEKDKAKKALMNAGLGFVSAFVLMVVLNNSMPVLTEWVSGNFTDPVLMAEMAASRAEAEKAAASSRAAVSAAEAAAASERNTILNSVASKLNSAVSSSYGKDESTATENIKNAVSTATGFDKLDMRGRSVALAMEAAAIESMRLTIQHNIEKSDSTSACGFAVQNARDAQFKSNTINLDNSSQYRTIETAAKKEANTVFSALIKSVSEREVYIAKITEAAIQMTTEIMLTENPDVGFWSSVRNDCYDAMNVALGKPSYLDKYMQNMLSHFARAAHDAAELEAKTYPLNEATIKTALPEMFEKVLEACPESFYYSTVVPDVLKAAYDSERFVTVNVAHAAEAIEAAVIECMDKGYRLSAEVKPVITASLNAKSVSLNEKEQAVVDALVDAAINIPNRVTALKYANNKATAIAAFAAAREAVEVEMSKLADTASLTSGQRNDIKRVADNAAKNKITELDNAATPSSSSSSKSGGGKR